MKKVYLAVIASLIIVLLTSWSDFASHELSPSQSVPLSELWEFYSEIRDYSFLVRECGFFEIQGGFQTGDLTSASLSAASTWNQSFPAIRISVEAAPCRSGAPEFRNGQHEIYWSGTPRGNAEVGDYMAYFVLNGELLEHDITVEPIGLSQFTTSSQMDPEIALYNLLLHELGHALGLNDAYLVDFEGCDWSVMLRLCPGGQISPQPADLAALQHIYSFAPRQSGSTPQPAPPASGGAGLQQFDINRSGYIEDEELAYAVDLWAVGTVTDEMFRQLLSAWVQQVRVSSLGKRHNTNVVTAIEVYDANGAHISSLTCATGDVLTRVGRALSHLHAPTAIYILAARDCNTNRVQITQSLYQGS